MNFKGQSNDAQWGAIKGLLAAGHSVALVAKTLNVARATVYRASEAAKPPSERERAVPKAKITPAQEREILRLADARHKVTGELEQVTQTKKRHVYQNTNPSLSSIHAKAVGKKIAISRSGVRRVLHKHGYDTCAVAPESFLDARAKRARRDFLTNSGATADNTAWSDETTIDSNGRRGRVWAKRKNGRKARIAGAPTETRPPAVSCWAAIGTGFKTDIHFVTMTKSRDPNVEKRTGLNSASYIRRCLAPNVELIRRAGKVLMQDGHKAHTAKRTISYLESKKVRFLRVWPANSSDLNPIEKLWRELKANVARRGPWGLPQLKRIIKEEWAKFSQEKIDRYVSHFTTARAAVLKAKGAHVK
jgi:transposase/ParB-like chromosome segregation protein Spo0J